MGKGIIYVVEKLPEHLEIGEAVESWRVTREVLDYLVRRYGIHLELAQVFNRTLGRQQQLYVRVK